MPLNIIEAMLCKKPVVASHNRGHDELVQPDKTGCLLSPGDVSGFADAIARLASDADKRWQLGEAGYAWIQPYTVRSTQKELLAALEEALV